MASKKVIAGTSTAAFLGIFFVFVSFINAIDAQHLDQSGVLLEKVFNEVSKQDGKYVSIPNTHTLRVTFEKKLTNKNDITIYARSQGANISVYVKNQKTLLGQFKVDKEGYYRLELNKLKTPHSSFDLKVSGNPVEFDYVTDPSTITVINPLNNSLQTINITIFNITYSSLNGTCNYSLDAGVVNKTMSNYSATGWTATNSSMLERNHNVTYYCINSENITTESLNTFTINLPPQNVSVSKPTARWFFVNGTMFINWTNSSLSDLPIGYNVTLYNTDQSFNKSIIFNNTALNYTWELTSNISVGSYRIGILAFDTLNTYSNITYSPIFNITSNQGNVTVSPGIGAIYFKPLTRTSTLVSPVGQNATRGIINVTNYLGRPANLTVRVNQTTSNWTFMVGNASGVYDFVNSTTNYTFFNQLADEGSQMLWVYTNLSGNNSFIGRILVDING